MLCVETRDKHIFAHNFLNIQPIYNPQKVLESWDLDLSKNTNAMYIKGVESYFDFWHLWHASTFRSKEKTRQALQTATQIMG